MDRIGAMRDYYRLQNQPMLTPAPIPSRRRVPLLMILLGLIAFFSGFAARDAQAASAGSVQYIVECVLSGSTTNTAPCSKVGTSTAGYKPVMVQAYVIDPASASFIDQLTTPFDYALGSAFWAFGFTGVMILYFSSHVIGLVLKKIKNG